MTAQSSHEIHVHLTSGSVSRFVVEDPAELQGILDHVHPQKVFSQQNLLIAGRHSMTVIPCSSVVRIDFVMDGFAGWEFHNNLVDALQITHEELRERYAPVAETTVRTENAVPDGSVVTAYAEAEMLGGDHVYVEAQLRTERRTPAERGMMLQHLLSGPSIYLRRRGGGAILLNAANVVRITLFPGPLETPPNAWPARRLGGI